MEITLIKDWGGKSAGEVVGVSDERGKHLKEIGIAQPDPEKVKPEKVSKPKPVKKTVKSKEVK